MGDRAYCSLRLKTSASAELLALLNEEMGDVCDDDNGENRWFGYDEVNYAELDKAVLGHLYETNTPFAWVHSAGAEYGEGALLFDGETVAELGMMDGSIVLTVEEAEDEAKRAHARKWQDFLSSMNC